MKTRIFVSSLLLIGAFFAFGPLMAGAQNISPGVFDNPSGSASPGLPEVPQLLTDISAGKKASASRYLNYLYLWFLGFVGVAALFGMVMGGVLYMFSGTSITKTDQAKKWFGNAIYGIILAAASFLLLEIINPDLVTHGFNLETFIEKSIQKAKTPGGGGADASPDSYIPIEGLSPEE